MIRRTGLLAENRHPTGIGVDYHPSFQQIAWVDTESGESGEQRLQHNEEAEKFYRELKERGVSVRIGMEVGGHARWFERLLAELGFESCMGDPAQISKKRVRKQKTDRQDAQLAVASAPDGADANADHESVAA